MDKPKIMILGGSGFIGSRLTDRLLKAGYEVGIGDIEKSTKFPELHVFCDVRERDQVLDTCKGYDIIYNLAAEHDDDVFPRERYYQTNVDGAEVVCGAASQLGIRRIVFTSTVAVYGLPEKETDEDDKPAPFNDYGRSKLQAEAVYNAWADEDPERSLVTARLTVVFGPENYRNFYLFLKQIASGSFLMIGDGRNHKSIAYVENVAAFLEYVLKYGPGRHLFNYVDKPDMEMNETIRLVCELTGSKPMLGVRIPYFVGYVAGLGCDAVAALTRRRFPISAVRIKKFCGNSWFAAQRIRDEGFEAPFALEEGLRKTIAHEFPSN